MVLCTVSPGGLQIGIGSLMYAPILKCWIINYSCALLVMSSATWHAVFLNKNWTRAVSVWRHLFCIWIFIIVRTRSHERSCDTWTLYMNDMEFILKWSPIVPQGISLDISILVNAICGSDRQEKQRYVSCALWPTHLRSIGPTKDFLVAASHRAKMMTWGQLLYRIESALLSC